MLKIKNSLKDNRENVKKDNTGITSQSLALSNTICQCRWKCHFHHIFILKLKFNMSLWTEGAYKTGLRVFYINFPPLTSWLWQFMLKVKWDSFRFLIILFLLCTISWHFYKNQTCSQLFNDLWSREKFQIVCNDYSLRAKATRRVKLEYKITVHF